MLKEKHFRELKLFEIVRANIFTEIKKRIAQSVVLFLFAHRVI
jgi:hypothetical protein